MGAGIWDGICIAMGVLRVWREGVIGIVGMRGVVCWRMRMVKRRICHTPRTSREGTLNLSDTLITTCFYDIKSASKFSRLLGRFRD